MSGFDKVARFWKEQASADSSAAPDDKLLGALGSRGRVWLDDVPGVLGMPENRALSIVESLRAQDKVVLMQETESKRLFLKLTSLP